MNRPAFQELGRTEHCKFVTNRGDGSGRDGYIVYDDGGLMPNVVRK